MFCELVNTRVHRVTRRAPVEMLAEELTRLHPVPAHPHTVAFGLTRVVPASMPMVAFEGGQYSVPHTLVGETVWVRVHGRGESEQVVILHIGATGPALGPVEVARHRRANPGSPKITAEHFPPAPAGAWGRRPRAKNPGDVEFLALGDGAHMWLSEAAAAGSTKMWVKMAQALGWAKLFDPGEVDWALGHAAVHGRFAEADLASIRTSTRTSTSTSSTGVNTGPVRTTASPRAPVPGPDSGQGLEQQPLKTASSKVR